MKKLYVVMFLIIAIGLIGCETVTVKKFTGDSICLNKPSYKNSKNPKKFIISNKKSCYGSSNRGNTNMGAYAYAKKYCPEFNKQSGLSANASCGVSYIGSRYVGGTEEKQNVAWGQVGTAVGVVAAVGAGVAIAKNAKKRRSSSSSSRPRTTPTIPTYPSSSSSSSRPRTRTTPTIPTYPSSSGRSGSSGTGVAKNTSSNRSKRYWFPEKTAMSCVHLKHSKNNSSIMGSTGLLNNCPYKVKVKYCARPLGINKNTIGKEGCKVTHHFDNQGKTRLAVQSGAIGLGSPGVYTIKPRGKHGTSLSANTANAKSVMTLYAACRYPFDPMFVGNTRVGSYLPGSVSGGRTGQFNCHSYNEGKY